MELSCRSFPASEFYQTYVKWSEAHNFPPLVESGLDTVFVCFRGDIPIYSCFFWRTPSTFAVIGFPLSNLEVPKEEREGGLDYLFSQIAQQAALAGYQLLWTTSSTPVIEELLQRQGFTQGDFQVNQYLKILA